MLTAANPRERASVQYYWRRSWLGPHQSGSSDKGKNPGWETAHWDPSDSTVNWPRDSLEALTKEAIPEVKQPPRYSLDSTLNGPPGSLAVLTKD